MNKVIFDKKKKNYIIYDFLIIIKYVEFSF